MATVLDLSLLQPFSFIFPFLVVFAIVFAILQKTKLISGSSGINSIIAVAAAFLVILSEKAILLLNFIIPWFAVAIVFFLLLILVFMVFGAKESDIFSAIKSDKAIIWVLLGIILAIMGAGFASVFGQDLTNAAFQPGVEVNVTGEGGVATPNYSTNLMATLFHPKILGIIVLFAIVIFAVLLLTG